MNQCVGGRKPDIQSAAIVAIYDPMRSTREFLDFCPPHILLWPVPSRQPIVQIKVDEGNPGNLGEPFGCRRFSCARAAYNSDSSHVAFLFRHRGRSISGLSSLPSLRQTESPLASPWLVFHCGKEECKCLAYFNHRETD